MYGRKILSRWARTQAARRYPPFRPGAGAGAGEAIGEQITAVDEWGREEGSEDSSDRFFRATQDFLTDGAGALILLTVVVVLGGASFRRCFGFGGGGGGWCAWT